MLTIILPKHIEFFKVSRVLFHSYLAEYVKVPIVNNILRYLSKNVQFLEVPDGESNCFIVVQMSVFSSVFHKHIHVADTNILEMKSPRGL